MRSTKAWVLVDNYPGFVTTEFLGVSWLQLLETVGWEMGIESTLKRRCKDIRAAQTALSACKYMERPSGDSHGVFARLKTIMAYMKQTLTPAVADTLRINLSVYPRKLASEPSCDFCGANNPVYVYAANRLSTGQPEQCWRWTACESCSAAVDADDWDTIQAKIKTWLTQRFGAVGLPAALIEEAVATTLLSFYHDASRL